MVGIEFREAVRGALLETGRRTLSDSRAFIGAVTDFCDPSSAEAVVLHANCSEEMLRPVAEAASGRDPARYEAAARSVESYLRDRCRVAPADARSVAWGVALGVADAMGVAVSSLEETEERARLQREAEESRRKLDEERRKQQAEEDFLREFDEERRKREAGKAHLTASAKSDAISTDSASKKSDNHTSYIKKIINGIKDIFLIILSLLIGYGLAALIAQILFGLDTNLGSTVYYIGGFILWICFGRFFSRFFTSDI